MLFAYDNSFLSLSLSLRCLCRFGNAYTSSMGIDEYHRSMDWLIERARRAYSWKLELITKSTITATTTTTQLICIEIDRIPFWWCFIISSVQIDEPTACQTFGEWKSNSENENEMKLCSKRVEEAKRKYERVSEKERVKKSITYSATIFIDETTTKLKKEKIQVIW